MNRCKVCNKPTNNPSFCSRACSTIFTNKNYQRRKWHCKKCGKSKAKPSKYARYCDTCNPKIHKYLTLGELRQEYKTRGKHPQNIYVYIREQARRKSKLLGMTSCSFCGYDYHVEIAHRKSISSFSDSSLIDEINSKDNILALCPNCHWEFDHPKFDSHREN